MATSAASGSLAPGLLVAAPALADPNFDGSLVLMATSEAFRQLKQGAVKVDGARVEDGTLSFAAGSTHVFQVGKRRLARVTLR